MLNRTTRHIAPGLLIVALAGLLQARADAAGIGLSLLHRAPAVATAPLQASGVIEATEISIGPEVGGRVVEVLAGEGDAVAAGQPLFRFDDQALQVERQLAATSGASAEAAARMALLAAQQTLDDLHDNASVVTAQAALDLANARDALDDVARKRIYQQAGNRATEDTIDATEARLVLAEEAVDEAEDAYRSLRNRSSGDPERAAALDAQQSARTARDAIKSTLNWYTGSPTDAQQAILDAQVGLAEAQLALAEAQFDKVRSGPDADAVALAEAQVTSAEADLATAVAKTSADLQAIDLQIEKLTVRAPMPGVVLISNLHAGEVLQPGGIAMTIGRLEDLRVTVFLAEDRYGQVALGDRAQVVVDSFPGESFPAVVSFIASQAEFTPRNVQTQEQRQTTVYAVELSISDAEGKLIPGMPADVTFR